MLKRLVNLGQVSKLSAQARVLPHGKELVLPPQRLYTNEAHIKLADELLAEDIEEVNEFDEPNEFGETNEFGEPIEEEVFEWKEPPRKFRGFGAIKKNTTPSWNKKKAKDKPKAPRWYVLAKVLGVLGVVGYRYRQLVSDIYSICRQAHLEDKDMWEELLKRANENMTPERLSRFGSSISLFNIASFDGSIHDKVCRLLLNSPILFKCDGDRDPREGEWNPAKEEEERQRKLFSGEVDTISKYKYYKQLLEEMDRAEKEKQEQEERNKAEAAAHGDEASLVKTAPEAPTLVEKEEEVVESTSASCQSDEHTNCDTPSQVESPESKLPETREDNSKLSTAFT